MMKKVATLIASSLLIAACSTTEKPGANQTQANAAADKSSPVAAQAQAATPAQTVASQLESLNKESVYFDFDKYEVKPAFRDAVRHEASWMQAHKTDMVTLEGNTDDRGSDEYNLALGNKRAQAVHRVMTAMGVPSARIKDVSFGESKPRATCEEEKCWQENRRVDFVHKLN